MSSELGERIKLSIFGESHSKGIGMVLEGIEAGKSIDVEEIKRFLKRRAPGQNAISTSRKEKDEPEFLSGISNGITTGTPICAVIANKDTRSEDYEKIKRCPRPSHADFAAYMKYKDAHDIRGGGHFSGRLTAPLCIAGAICKQLLKEEDIFIGGHISSVGQINDDRFDVIKPDKEQLLEITEKEFPAINDEKASEMIREIKKIQKLGDSVGGTIECCIAGLMPGIGEPIFGGMENRISQAVFGIPAVKGIEFGSGFEGSRICGSKNNDQFYIDGETVRTKTNNSGGILGGISNGMPVVFNVAFKPTPSISIKQDTVDLVNKENTTMKIEGRHDPCIVPRAVPCVEAAAAIVILDLIYERKDS